MPNNYLWDKHGNRYSVSIISDEILLHIIIRWKQIEVGQIKCVIHSENALEIGDIEIFKHPYFPRNGCLQFPPLIRPHRNFRQLGLGSAMLKYLISYAGKLGTSNIYGTVIHRDLNQTPYLLDWYQKHGFEIDYVTHHSPGVIGHIYMEIKKTAKR